MIRRTGIPGSRRPGGRAPGPEAREASEYAGGYMRRGERPRSDFEADGAIRRLGHHGKQTDKRSRSAPNGLSAPAQAGAQGARACGWVLGSCLRRSTSWVYPERMGPDPSRHGEGNRRRWWWAVVEGSRRNVAPTPSTILPIALPVLGRIGQHLTSISSYPHIPVSRPTVRVRSSTRSIPAPPGARHPSTARACGQAQL